MGIVSEAKLLAASFSCGIIVLICYDVLLSFRTARPVAKLLTAFIDVTFWGISGVITYYVMYNINAGILRLYAIVGVIAGMLIYHNTISGCFRRAVTRLVRTMLRIFDKMLVKPVTFLIRGLKKAMQCVIMSVRGTVDKESED